MDRNNQLDQLFQTAREQKPLQSFDETKDQFLNALNSKDGGSGARKGKFSFTKKWIIMIVSVSIIAGLVLLLTTEPIEKSKKQNVTQVSTENRASNVKMLPNENKSEKQPIASTITTQAKSYTLDQTFVIEQLDIQAIAEDTASLYPSVDRPQVNAAAKDEYVFPKLTEEEIAANHKQKKQMLKALVYAMQSHQRMMYVQKHSLPRALCLCGGRDRVT